MFINYGLGLVVDFADNIQTLLARPIMGMHKMCVYSENNLTLVGCLKPVNIEMYYYIIIIICITITA